MEADEVLDLVDKNDEVIGTILRGDYAKLLQDKLGYIRAVDLFIQNDKGELWIPTRTADKTIAPNGLDYSMGGHVGSGETYTESALREVKEELNLDLTEHDLQFIKKFSPDHLAYFRKLYIYHSNVFPNYNPADFVGAQWMTPQKLIETLKSGIPAKESMLETVEALISIQNT